MEADEGKEKKKKSQDKSKVLLSTVKQTINNIKKNIQNEIRLDESDESQVTGIEELFDM